MEISQYQIVLVNLDPTVGHEIKKARPCLVISPDEMNRHLQTIIIAPITSQSRSYPTRVQLAHDKLTGWIVLDQIRTVDRKRIIKKVGGLSGEKIDLVKGVIREMLVES
ncbi:MAG: type II toxin-antitoxin system PemK/MazF family toxin [Bacteroidota bacterium]|nr:type II toxin-antitoxin system PemK/MazF family toxin [Bacteroidota bacterium]